jgi:dihydroorotate dehydrogenase electron transfer subunit
LEVDPRAAQGAGTEVIYAAGPRPMLRTVAEFCMEQRIPAQVAVEEERACGTGLCFACVVPVIRKDGSGYDNLRACTEGPVFNPARVFWDRWTSEETRAIPTPPEGFPSVVSSWPG